jgi:hypothetical protein
VFDVALWVTWPALFPEYVMLVMASSAFAAASTRDGSLVYRACTVKIVCEGWMLHSQGEDCGSECGLVDAHSLLGLC